MFWYTKLESPRENSAHELGGPGGIMRLRGNLNRLRPIYI